MPKTNPSTTTTSNQFVDLIKNDPLYAVVEAYLDTVKTKSGQVPSKEVRDNFILTCLTYKLSPIKKQIYLLGYDRRDGQAVFTEVPAASGFTAIAHRTGQFAGIDQAKFIYNGQNLESCSVTVYRMIQGQRCPFTASAYFDERSKDDFGIKTQFKSQPKTMLEKCARAAALRIAFPEELGNKYDIDEMPRETEPVRQTTAKIEPAKPEENQINLVKETIRQLAPLRSKTEEELESSILDTFKVKDIEELSPAQIQTIVDQGQAKIKELQNKEALLDKPTPTL